MIILLLKKKGGGTLLKYKSWFKNVYSPLLKSHEEQGIVN